MNLYQSIINKQEKIAVIGLGYVGLPLAVAFGKKVNVVGFDVNKEKVNLYRKGIDVTKEVGNEILKGTTIRFTTEESELKKSKFHIVAVPTPINDDKTPNLKPLMGATKTSGRNLTKGSIVVFESTVYPGVTEDICIPILEEESGLKYGRDFKVGYSPERINPGDKVRRLENITKVVSGTDEQSLEIIAKVYELVVEVGVYKAKSIKVAEAAKVIENSQRDINIAFMNELSIIFNKLDIDTQAVLEAAGTKWNFLNFTPGLVGGHCIGVDPYYLTYKAEQTGYHSQIILSGRKINDNMGKYVAENTVKHMIKGDKHIKGSTVAILGITFKENCPDVRNTKVIDVINELKEYGIKVILNDPQADKQEVLNQYGIEMFELEEISDVDAVILAVPHEEYNSLTLGNIKELYNNRYAHLNEIAATLDDEFIHKDVLIDIKGILDRKEAEENDFIYWRL